MSLEYKHLHGFIVLLMRGALLKVKMKLFVFQTLIKRTNKQVTCLLIVVSWPNLFYNSGNQKAKLRAINTTGWVMWILMSFFLFIPVSWYHPLSRGNFHCHVLYFSMITIFHGGVIFTLKEYKTYSTQSWTSDALENV